MFCFQERSVPVSLPGTRAETVVEAARSVAVEAVQPWRRTTELRRAW